MLEMLMYRAFMVTYSIAHPVHDELSTVGAPYHLHHILLVHQAMSLQRHWKHPGMECSAIR